MRTNKAANKEAVQSYEDKLLECLSDLEDMSKARGINEQDGLWTAVSDVCKAISMYLVNKRMAGLLDRTCDDNAEES